MSTELKQAVQQSLDHFLSNWYYNANELRAAYHIEIHNFSNEKWDAPRRAARLSAAVKKYKTSAMLQFIFDIGLELELDLTPLTVKRLCNAFFGRTGSQSIIVDIFGNKERQHRSNDSTPERIEAIVKQYKHDADHYWKEALLHLEYVKRGYQNEINTRKSKAAARKKEMG